MGVLDIFDSDAFSIHELTLAIDKLPYTPQRVGQMNLFTSKPLTTSIAIIEERDNVLSLLPTMPRGSEQQTTRSRATRKVRAFPIPHLPYWHAILAGELEGKRAFGEENKLEVFSQIVNDELEKMKQDHEVTSEYHRLGALRGIVLDADGSTELYDWFDEFGVTQDVVDFNFYDPGTWDLAEPVMIVKSKAQEVVRLMEDALGGTSFSGIHCFCGYEFFDALVTHPTVRKAYEWYQNNSFNRELQTIEGGFEFAGITWERYRGKIGSVNFVEPDEAQFFPLGTRDVFVEAIAPADFIETVNTRGQRIYAKQERMKWDKGIELHTQSNILYMCSRPKVLIKGTMSNAAPTTTA